MGAVRCNNCPRMHSNGLPFVCLQIIAVHVTVANTTANPKRGFGATAQNAELQDMEKLVGNSWYYNWGLTTDFEHTSQEFVPMLWGKGSLSKLAGWTPLAETTTILGFNEPNLH